MSVVQPELKELGQIVRDRRLDLGMSQVDVALRAGISEPAYRALETGRTRSSDRTLSLVSRALDLPTHALRSIRDDLESNGSTTTSLDLASIERRHESIALSASGVDLDELHRLDPDAYELIIAQAQLALDRARERNR